MNKRIYVALFALGIMLVAIIAPVSKGQTRVASASTRVVSDPLTALPPSDAVILIDMKRLLTDVLPRSLAGNPSRLAQANTEIDDFKRRTGVDIRSFDRVAVGMRYLTPSAGTVKTETVAIGRGSFNAAGIIAAGRLAANGRYQEQKYRGGTIYIFRLNDQVKLLGLLNIKLRDIAVTTLDAGTLAIGDPTGVRAAFDASNGGGRVSNELVQLASRNPNAFIGFGTNLPSSVTQNLNIGNDEIARNAASVRQAYGSVSTTATGYELFTVARTEKPDQAQSLNDMLAGLKQLGSIFAARLPAAKGRLAQNALDNLKLTTQGNELQIRLAVSQEDISAVLLGLAKTQAQKSTSHSVHAAAQRHAERKT